MSEEESWGLAVSSPRAAAQVTSAHMGLGFRVNSLRGLYRELYRGLQ